MRTILILLMLGVTVSSVFSQSPAPVEKGASVLLIVPDSFPDASVKALVVRYASPTERELIVLKKADAEYLAVALAVLRDMETKHGNLSRDQVIPVRGFAPVRKNAERGFLKKYDATIQKLLRQPRSRVGNLGTGRWIELPGATVQP